MWLAAMLLLTTTFCTSSSFSTQSDESTPASASNAVHTTMDTRRMHTTPHHATPHTTPCHATPRHMPHGVPVSQNRSSAMGRKGRARRGKAGQGAYIAAGRQTCLAACPPPPQPKASLLPLPLHYHHRHRRRCRHPCSAPALPMLAGGSPA